jgi:hypothetical protein
VVLRRRGEHEVSHQVSMSEPEEPTQRDSEALAAVAPLRRNAGAR